MTGDGNVLDGDDRVLVDTNVFVSIGEPEHSKFQRLRDVVRSSGVVLTVPEQVRDELAVHPNERRLSTAVDEGWAEVVSPPDPTSSHAVDAIDRARRELANQTGSDEHEVEKADTMFAGLAVEYLHRGDEQVSMVTDDGPAATAIRRAIEAGDVRGSVHVLALRDVLGSDDDDVRIL